MLYLTATALLAAVASAASNINIRQENHLKIDFSISRGNSLLSTVESDEYALWKRGGSAELSLLNTQQAYFATLKFGSQGAENLLQIDTGSSDTWVMDKNVTCDAESDSSQDANNCTALGTFDVSESTSFRFNSSYGDDFSISYGDLSSASGNWGIDYIAFGDFNISDFSFAVVTETDSLFGILGIGFAGLETTNTPNTYISPSFNYTPPGYEYENFPLRLKSTGVINKVLYSLYLNSSDVSSGSLLFGSVDHAKYSGQLQTVPIINVNLNSSKPVDFNIVLSSVSLESETRNISVSNTHIAALLDSGTTLTYVPQAILDPLVSSLGGALRDDEVSTENGIMRVDCTYNTTTVKVIFNFSGVEIRVPLADLIITHKSQCYLGVLSKINTDDTDSVSSAILGDNFIRNAYIVYDLEDYEISLAQARYSNSEDIEVVSNSVPSAVKAASYSATSFTTSFTVNSGSVTAVLSSSEFKTKSGSITSNSSSSASASASSSSTHSGSKKSGASKVVYFAGSILFGIMGACGVLIL